MVTAKKNLFLQNDQKKTWKNRIFAIAARYIGGAEGPPDIAAIAKNSQGRNFSPNPWGGPPFLKATFIHLPTVKISPKSDKNPASDMDLKFAKFPKILRAVILVKIRGEAHI